MTVGNHTLTFGYDASGTPLYVQWNDSRFFYATNLQGDVIAIVSVNGIPVVEYTYDAWGNVLTVTGTRASNLGKLNPIRYRGYVYDIETELYYLQSRYYDPELGRFINADSYVSTGQGLLGNNMFAYCRNNPINRIDISGTADADYVDEDPLDEEDMLKDSQGGGVQSSGKGFSSFKELKNFLGSAGKNKHWHHIVEQCQEQKSGFPSEQIQNTSNVIAIDAKTHAKITGYYNTTTFTFTNGLSVRNWLSGQPYAVQYDFGIGVLQKYGVIN